MKTKTIHNESCNMQQEHSHQFLLFSTISVYESGVQTSYDMDITDKTDKQDL